MSRQLHAAAALLAFLATPVSGFAQTATGSPPPTLPDSVDWVAYYSAVCGDVDHYVDMTDTQREALDLEAPIKQRLSYCIQAKMSQRGYHFGIISSSTASASAAICTASCVSSLTSGAFTFGISKAALDRACTIAGLASNLTTMGLSIGMARDFGDWMKANATSLVSLGMSAKSALTAASGAGTSSISVADKIESCVGAAFMVAQAGMYSYQTGQARGPWGQALYQAGQLKSTSGAGIAGNDSGFVTARASLSGAGTQPISPSRITGASGMSEDACAKAVVTRSVVASSDCATALGTQFNSGVYSPEFQDTFKQVAKRDLDSFLKSGGDFASALSPSLSGAQAEAALRGKQQEMLTAALADPRMAEYASLGTGGSRGARRGKSDNSLGDLSNLFKSLLPGAAGSGKPDPAALARGQAYGNAGRGVASTTDAANDPRVNLFDRVSTAYRIQSTRAGIAGAEAWSLPINRASHGLK